MRRYLLICLAIFGLLIFGQNVLAADWSVSTLDSSANSGWDSSIAVDSNGYSHVAYIDGANVDLKYATNESGLWVVTTVEDVGSVGAGVSIKVDSNNKPHISYIDDTNNYLKYATNSSGSWVTTDVDNSGTVSSGIFDANVTSIALSSNNIVSISYYDNSNDDLKYATNASGGWVLTTVDSTGNVGAFDSLDIDSNGYAHISYRDQTNNTLKYATNSLSGVWSVSTLDSSVDAGWYSSLAIGLNNSVHISYLDATNDDLKYITNATGSWVATNLDTTNQTGYTTSIVVDNNGGVHIGYADNTDQALKYATNISGSWTYTTLDTVGTYASVVLFGYYNQVSLATSLNNRVFVSYFDANNSYLKYAYTPGPSDQTTTINNGRSYSAKKKIHITSSLTGSPTEMIVSTKSDFSDKTWKAYTTDKTFEMSSELGKKTIYVKYRDIWHAESDVVSAEVKYTGSPIKFVTTKAKAKSEKRVTEKNKNYYARDLYLKFKKYPKSFKNTRRYIQIDRKLEYPHAYMDAKNNLLKKYWKISTDFSKYSGSKNVKLRLVFQYTDNQFEKLKKKVKNLKEKNLYLKYYVPESNSWADLQVKPNTTDNTFTIYLNSPFNYSERYYAIGR
ncbi:MAG: hypothetical protein PHN19_03830 [Patescibacteria group bacterium]|nr:hypothetical protein [Patescibacteria group bacterium]